MPENTLAWRQRRIGIDIMIKREHSWHWTDGMVTVPFLRWNCSRITNLWGGRITEREDFLVWVRRCWNIACGILHDKIYSVQRNRWTPIVVFVVLSLFGLLGAWSYKQWRFQHEVEGTIFVENKNFQLIDSIECKRNYVYGVGDAYVDTKYTYNRNNIHVKHSGPGQDSYTYFFSISGEGVIIKVRLDFYEETDDLHEVWNIIVDICQKNGRWDAIIRSPDGSGSMVECTDIEKNGIALEYWSVADEVQHNYSIQSEKQ